MGTTAAMSKTTKTIFSKQSREVWLNIGSLKWSGLPVYLKTDLLSGLERIAQILARLTGDGRQTPVGTAANSEERERLMATPGFDINEVKRRMQGATQALKHELGGLRTGRAAASMRSSHSRSTRPQPVSQRSALTAARSSGGTDSTPLPLAAAEPLVPT